MNQRFCNGMIHVIKQGDNLYQLSRKYRVPLALILRANPYVDVYNLKIGQEICIPMYRQPVQRPFPGPAPAPGPAPVPMPEPAPMPRPEPRREMPQMQPEEEEMLPVEEESGRERNFEEPLMQEDNREEQNAYHCDGTKSLGWILKECGMTMDEFWERNDPEHIIIASDVVLTVPKRV